MTRMTLRDSLPTVAAMARNIVAAYDATDAATRAAGRAWYPAAHGIAREVAQTLSMGIDAGAGILAGYSAGTRWSTNVRMARATAATGEPVAHRFGGSMRARRILGGESAADVITGAKLSAFYLTILDPANVATTVVVDRWAFHVATGLSAYDAARYLTNANIVADIAEAFRVAATARNEEPGDIQAITWLPVAADSRN